MNISSNTAVNSTDTSDCQEYYSNIAWPNDQWSQCTITVSAGTYSTDDGGGTVVRQSSSAATYYRWVINDNATNNIDLQKVVTGTFTDLGTHTVSYVGGQVIYLSAQGTTLTGQYNSSTVATTTDNAISSGNAGIGWSSDGTSKTGTYTLWSGGDFSGGAVTILTRTLTGMGF